MPKPKSKKAENDGPTVTIDFEFKKLVEKVVDGTLVNYCYQCGACVGDCPSARYLPAFNPREIMLKVLYGFGEELVGPDSPVWECTNCYNCYERCPQNVKPVEIIIAIKNLMAQRGIYPEKAQVGDLVNTVLETGRTAPVTSMTKKLREELGLTPLPDVDTSEIKKILE
jgi:heterodisulfide reductase subunit C